MNTKGYFIENEKDNHYALEIARREKDTDDATVIDETEVVFAN